MMRSEVVKVAIERPFAEVYAFLAEPLNFTQWAANPGSEMSPVEGHDWLVELPPGPRVVRFTPRNPYGVLDYQAFPTEESSGPVTPVRLMPNGSGSELWVTWYQRPGISDERFSSDLEWLQADLGRLKTLLEVGK
jgi:hypothetical protein